VARATVGGITLEYEDYGSGEPVVCIHGAFVADAFRTLRSEPDLADRFRLITYSRRGYAGSTGGGGPSTLAEQADDCRALLSHLGVRRAHVVGHSLGGAVALALALREHRVVHSLTLLEAALMIGDSSPLYRQGLADSLERYREVGAVIAVDEFLERRWPGYREPLDRALPGAFEQAVTDAATFFDVDLPAVVDFRFGPGEARRIAQPALVVLGEESSVLDARFGESYRLLLEWLPDAEGFVLPRATHFLQVENPRDLAEALVGFLGRHPLGGHPAAA
jgi:pimeloyl-ACP methyl ester carboxylesterase